MIISLHKAIPFLAIPFEQVQAEKSELKQI